MINYYPWAVYCESPPRFIWGEGGAKNEGLLYLQSTIDIHILNMFRLTVGIHFQNTLLLPLSLLLCSLLLPNCEGSHSVRLFETTDHYFFECNHYAAQRRSLLNDIAGLDCCHNPRWKNSYFLDLQTQISNNQSKLTNYYSNLGSLPLRRIPLRRIPLRRIPLRRIPLRRIPLCRIPLCRIPLCRIPLCRIPLCRIPLRVAPRSLFQQHNSTAARVVVDRQHGMRRKDVFCFDLYRLFWFVGTKDILNYSKDHVILTIFTFMMMMVQNEDSEWRCFIDQLFQS